MLPIARRNKIKELILEKKSVTVAELTDLFHVTEETIRRDLKQLEDGGFLHRTYGGAYISNGVQNDVDIKIREDVHVEGKKKIARLCLPFIKNGDSIFLDASTTSLMIATMIADQHLTVVTNAIKVVNTLIDKSNINLVIIGGTLSRKSHSNLGPNAEANLSNYFFDSAFISCRSASIQHGITDANEQQAVIRKIAAEHAINVFLVTDHTKLDKTSFASICDFGLIGTLIVDETLSSEWKQFLTDNHVETIEAK